jgi:hypothetical protein
MARRPMQKRAEPQAGLPAELAQAHRFGKTRSAQSTALLEDYVELIADLLAATGEARPTDIARRLGVSHATVIKTISRLKREGLATGLSWKYFWLWGFPARLLKLMPRESNIMCRKQRSKRSAGFCICGHPQCSNLCPAGSKKPSGQRPPRRHAARCARLPNANSLMGMLMGTL